MSEDVNQHPGDRVRVYFVGGFLGDCIWAEGQTRINGLTYEVVERSTPPAPDPIGIDEIANAIVSDYRTELHHPPDLGDVLLEIIIERLAGLQAPPTSNAIMNGYERHLNALLSVIGDIADFGPSVALENLGDYLNGCDAVEDDDIEVYERAQARLGLQAPPQELAPNPGSLLEAMQRAFFAQGDETLPTLEIIDLCARVASGLQAPPVDDAYPGYPTDPAAWREVVPVDDEPVGWANRYSSEPEWGRPWSSPVEARRVRRLTEQALEVAVPLYRRPGVQTPAAEDPLLLAHMHPDFSAQQQRLSAGVQSPPATPEPGTHQAVKDVGVYRLLDEIDAAVKAGWLNARSMIADAALDLRNDYPVPDPETETTE